MNKWWRLFRKVAGWLLAVLILFELLVLGLRLVGGEQAVAKLPVYIWKVTSDSMYPKIKSGTCILCVDVPFKWLDKGDVITYESNGDWITHEIVRVNEDGTVTTKGRANSYEDGKISEQEYVGKMVFRLPFFSTFLTLTESLAGKVIFIAIVLLACFGYPLGMKLAERAGKRR